MIRFRHKSRALGLVAGVVRGVRIGDHVFVDREVESFLEDLVAQLHAFVDPLAETY